MREEIVFIVGPTSVGKSQMALELAARAGGEIVNADAFQVYDGLALLTSRPNAATRRAVPHHLFGTVALSEPYNVARYLTEASRCLAEIRGRGRPAIVVGGTGLYVKALTHGLSPLPASDPGVRDVLEARDLADLVEELGKVDPLAAQIDAKNKRRVVRALEVTLATGKPFSSFRETWAHSSYGEGRAGLFLDRGREDLKRRIDFQVDRMFDAGVADEIRALPPDSVGGTAGGAIGLAEIVELIGGRLSVAECKERIKTRTARYAKRQVTWFKRELIFQRLFLPPSETVSSSTLDRMVGPPSASR